MAHPVQSVVESLYAAGRCPRLHVNALFEGVVCPDFIREQWRERLILDLDTSYPLDLEYTEAGLSADLSFGGYVTRCTFPWNAIYVVADKATGRGIVLEQNMPETVRRSRQSPTTGPLPDKADLRPVFASEGDADGAERVEIRPTDAEPSPEQAEERAQARRAAFKLIDGGD